MRTGRREFDIYGFALDGLFGQAGFCCRKFRQLAKFWLGNCCVDIFFVLVFGFV